MKLCSLWQTPSCWANGQTNKLSAPPAPLALPPRPPGHPVLALTVSSPRVWEVVGLLSCTSFRVFDSLLAIESGLPLICKYQHGAPEPASSFLLYFSLCLCLQALGATSVYTETPQTGPSLCPRRLRRPCSHTPQITNCYPRGSYISLSLTLPTVSRPGYRRCEENILRGSCLEN